MNSVQLSGIITTPPEEIDRGKYIHFMLKARYPFENGNPQIGVAYIPCGVSDATPKQREILLGKKHKSFRVEACGKLEEIIIKGERNKKSVTLGMLINSNGLLLHRRRR